MSDRIEKVYEDSIDGYIDELTDEIESLRTRIAKIEAPDTVTITISREDAEELLRVAEKREDPYSWMHGGAWAYASELRLRAALEEAVMVETPNLTNPNVKEIDHA